MSDKEKKSLTGAQQETPKPKKKSAKNKAGKKQAGQDKASTKKGKKTTANPPVSDQPTAAASSASPARAAKGADIDAKAKERIAIAAASAAQAGHIEASTKQSEETTAGPAVLDEPTEAVSSASPARAAKGADIDAKAKERIAIAAASAAAALSSESKPHAVDSLLGAGADRAAEAPPSEAESTDMPSGESLGNAGRAAVAPVESIPPSPNPSNRPARSSRTRYLSTLLVLILLAIAVFFYVRAISPIQTAKDAQPAESMITGGSDSQAGAPSQDTESPVSNGEINPRLIEALSKHLPKPTAEPPASLSTLRPLPDEQMELIRQVFAPEPGAAMSNNSNEGPESR